MHAWSSAPMDALTAAYFMAFAVGALFSFTAWLLGCVRGGGGRRFGRGGARAAARTGGGRTGARVGARVAGARGPIHAPTASRGWLPVLPEGALSRVCAPLFDMSAWAAMLCVGGGVGYLLRATGGSALYSLVVAIPSGLSAGYLLGALVEMLRGDTRYVEPASIEGTVATVLAPIGRGTTGEVVFVKAGTRRALPATSADGDAIGRGTEVIVLDYARGIARVTPTSNLLD